MTRFLAPPPGAAPARPAPTFSVVVRAYQAAATIGTALESALRQTAPAHEIIVVDDGSTDDLAGALAPYRHQIVLVRMPHGGGARAYNAGLAAATGEFVVALDADDVYDPRRLEALGALGAARPDLDLLATDILYVQGDAVVGRFGRVTPFSVDDQRTAILRSCFVTAWPAVRASRLRAVGGFDDRFSVAHDWECWVRLILDGAVAGMVDEPLLLYRVHASSLTGDRVASFADRVAMLENARRNPSLRPQERAPLERELRLNRERLAFARAQRALSAGTGPARRWSLLAAALGAGLRPGVRARLALAAALPAAARRRLPTQRPTFVTRLEDDELRRAALVRGPTSGASAPAARPLPGADTRARGAAARRP